MIYHFTAAALLLLIWACNKGASDAPITNSRASLDVVNATDNALNVYQNGGRLNSTANIYAQGSSGYLSVLAGRQNYSFKKPFNTDSINQSITDTLFSKQLSLTGTSHYSLFITGRNADNAFLVNDSLQADTAGMAKFRFVNATTSFGALRLTLNDTLVFNSQASHSASNFITAKPYTKVIKVYTANSSLPVATASVTFTYPTIYTIFASNKPGSNGVPVVNVAYYVNQ